MTCEQFAVACLDFRSMPEGSPEREAMLAHLRACPHCAALQANWQTLQDDLRYLGKQTGGAETPARVEMRLLQEFRIRHRTPKARRFALAGAWALAAAALLAIGISWWNWHRGPGVRIVSNTPGIGAPAHGNANDHQPATGVELGDTLVASSSSGDFTLLPGSTPSPMEDATVVRVQMQRGALNALGLTVNEEHASDLIQVDLLVGDDGLPQAVRLPETTE